MDKIAEQQISQKLNLVNSNGSTSEIATSSIKNFIENWKDITNDKVEIKIHLI